jgi:hypothetical protein
MDKVHLHIYRTEEPSSWLDPKPKEVWVILNKDMIILGKTMNRYCIFARARNIKNVLMDKTTRWSMKSGLANVSNLHTSTICCMDLLLPGVLLMHGCWGCRPKAMEIPRTRASPSVANLYFITISVTYLHIFLQGKSATP